MRVVMQVQIQKYFADFLTKVNIIGSLGSLHILFSFVGEWIFIIV